MLRNHNDDNIDDKDDDGIETTEELMPFVEAEFCFSNKTLIKTYVRNDPVQDSRCTGYQNKEITAPDVTSNTH